MRKMDCYVVTPGGQWVHVAVTYDTREVGIWVNGQRTKGSVMLYRGLENVSFPAELHAPLLLLKEQWPGAPTMIGKNETGQFPFEGRIAEVRLSRSVFYRGSFTPAANLSAGPDTQFLFHLKPTTEEFPDVTGSYTATLNGR
jgi:hypothetical protein